MRAPYITRSHTRTHTHVRDGETARVSLNDQVCWKKTGITTEEGTQVCGQNQPKNEKKYPVYGCSIKFPGSGTKPLKIRVWTDLDEPAEDESFGIDNLLIRREKLTFPLICRFDGTDHPACCDNGCCDRLATDCGKFGKICGGFNLKGRNDEIVFSLMAPAGEQYTYYVTMDFIKIDSWFES